MALLSGNWSNVGIFWTGASPGAFTRQPGMDDLPAALESDARSGEAGDFCTSPAIRSLPANLLTEVIATTCLIVVGFQLREQSRSSTGLPGRIRPVVWGSRVGNRPESCGYWIRNESGSATLVRASPTLFCPISDKEFRLGIRVRADLGR